MGYLEVIALCALGVVAIVVREILMIEYEVYLLNKEKKEREK